MNNEDYLQTLDYWTKYGAFGVEDYQEKLDYIEAQQFWEPRKLELLTTFKDKPEVIHFLNNLTLMCFYKNNPPGAYCISLILKDCKPQRPCFSHAFIDLNYNPQEVMKKRIKLSEYDGFQYDVYDELMDPNYCDATFDDERIHREVTLAFLKTMGWEDVSPEDVSTIFTQLFIYFKGEPSFTLDTF